MTQINLLLVDDDDFIRKVYGSAFAEQGFNVEYAVDGEQALIKIAEKLPDFVLLDLIMPKKNGFEVLAELQKLGTIKQLPVMIFTKLAQKEDRDRALSLGAVDYLIKDQVTIETMINRVRQILAARVQSSGGS